MPTGTSKPIMLFTTRFVTLLELNYRISDTPRTKRAFAFCTFAQILWSKLLPGSRQPLLCFIYVQHNLQISRTKIIYKNGRKKTFKGWRTHAENSIPLFQRKMLKACRQGPATLSNEISELISHSLYLTSNKLTRHIPSF